MSYIIDKLLKMFAGIFKRILPGKGLKGSSPHAFPIVNTLPPGDAPIGTVINGTRDGPRFDLPEGSFSDLQNVGVFGPSGCGKTYIMKSIALETMRKGNTAWIFDIEDEFSDLVAVVDEPYKPITITPENLRLNFFQPPGEGITVKRWRESIASILRSEMYIRDGPQNLFNKTLNVLLKKKGIFAGNNQFPSLVEVLCALKLFTLPYSSSRCNSCLESLYDRTERLVDTYEETAHVTNSDMLETLANKSVVFRFHNIRGITLLFLLNFLLMWLAYYRRSVDANEKVQTLFIDGQYFLREAKFRNDIGDTAVQAIASTGAKRGLRLVLATQLISELDKSILDNLSCHIIARSTNPNDIILIQRSMGLSPDQALSMTCLQRREVVVSYDGHPSPFKVRVHDFSFPPRPDEPALEKNAQDFLNHVTWTEDNELAGDLTDLEVLEAITGDALKVFVRIAEKPETVYERCEALMMDRNRECRARKALTAKGWIDRDEVTIGNKIKICGLTARGEALAEKLGIKVKRVKSGIAHEYLLNRVEKKISCSLNASDTSFQINSEITRKSGLQPDLVLDVALDYRAVIRIICGNVEREAKILNELRAMHQVDMIIAIVANKRLQKALQDTLSNNRFQEHSDIEPVQLAVLDAETCLGRTFDWASVLNRCRQGASSGSTEVND